MIYKVPHGGILMKIKKILLSIAACLIAVLSYSQVALAAPQQMADGQLFDAEFYAAAYPDVAAVFGTDPNMLYLHYVLCGQTEGRLPYAADGSVVAPLPVNNLAQTQLDVFSALVGHGRVFENGRITEQSSNYLRIDCPEQWWGIRGTGINVYKDESVLFDAAAYASMNPDLAAIYGTDKTSLWNEYKTEGVYQGRPVAGTTLNANAKLMIIQVASQITTPAMTVDQKIKAVHDWMVNYANYDETYMDVSQTLEGFMYNRTAVCAGYAKTFEYFMTVLGIPCETITGGEHAWNRVAVNGVWLYIDVTWDDPVYTVNGVRRDKLAHTYFLITEAQMNRDHYPAAIHDYY